jgi:hypothetical protein
VSDPGIEKGKKRRRRSARAYVNVARLSPDEIRDRLAAVADYFPPDDDGDDAGARGKAIAAAGIPPRFPDYAAERVSESLNAGHAAASPGDHGRGAGRPGEVSWGHPDLRQSSVSFGDVIARLRTQRGDALDPPGRDPGAGNGMGGFAYAGQVALRAFDAAGEAGAYRGMDPRNQSPARPDYHPARGSGTPPNGSHSTASPASMPRQSMKNSDRLEIMKETMRRIG